MKVCFALCAVVLLATICNCVEVRSSGSDVSRASTNCPKGYEKTNRACYYNSQCESGVGICKGGRCCKKKNPHKGHCPRDFHETNRKCRSNYDCGKHGICKHNRCCEKKKNPNKNNCPHGYKETNRNCSKDRDCGRGGICRKKRCCKRTQG